MLKFLEHKWTANIVGIINALAAIAAVIATVWYAQTSVATAPKTDTGARWNRTDIYWLIIIASIVLSNVVYVLSRIRRNNIIKHDIANLRAFQETYYVIGKLSALQGSYILTPKFVTAAEHGNHSKERHLCKGGTADILTNSLKYDLFFENTISENIIKGAKYIYVLPNTNSVLQDLRNYITIIRNSIHKRILSQNVDGSVPELENLCKTNLEFWFFHGEIPCLYNFAIFRQNTEGESRPFDSYCWYINPLDDKPDSHMLAYTVQDTRDKSELDLVFAKLKEHSSKKNGQEVYDNRDKLGEWIGGKQ